MCENGPPKATLNVKILFQMQKVWYQKTVGGWYPLGSLKAKYCVHAPHRFTLYFPLLCNFCFPPSLWTCSYLIGLFVNASWSFLPTSLCTQSGLYKWNLSSFTMKQETSPFIQSNPRFVQTLFLCLPIHLFCILFFFEMRYRMLILSASLY